MPSPVSLRPTFTYPRPALAGLPGRTPAAMLGAIGVIAACGGGVERNRDFLPVGCSAEWSELGVGSSTVYVDAAAEGGGDGSEAEPFRVLQTGLDIAGLRGASLVAVEAGRYVENLYVEEAHSGLTVRGRCAAGVVIDGSGGNEHQRTVDLSLDADVGFDHLTITGGPHGGLVLDGAFLTLLDVVVTENQLVNLFASTSTVTLTDVTISHGLPADGAGGYGIEAVDGAWIEGVGVALLENTGAGIVLSDQGTSATLEASTISGTLANPATGEGGRGAVVSDAADLIVSDSTFEDNGQTSIYAFSTHDHRDRPPDVYLEDVRILSTLPFQAGDAGDAAGIHITGTANLSALNVSVAGSEVGIRVDDFGGATLNGVSLSTVQPATAALSVEDRGYVRSTTLDVGGPFQFGAFARGKHAVLKLVDTSVHDLTGDGGGAAMGLYVSESAMAIVDGGTFARIQGGGLYTETGASITANALTIEDISPILSATGAQTAFAVTAIEEGVIELRGCTLDRNQGVSVFGASGATLTISGGGTIRDTQAPDGSTAAVGVALYATDERATTLILEDTTITGTAGIGLDLWGVEAHATLTSVTFDGNLPSPASDDASAAILVTGGAHLDILDSAIQNQTGHGILVDSGENLDPNDDDTRSVVHADGLTVEDVTSPDGQLTSGASVRAGGSFLAQDSVFQGVGGPALHASAGGEVEYERCLVSGVEFSGVALQEGGLARLWNTTIEATNADFGIWVDSSGAELDLGLGTSVAGGALASVYIGGEGRYDIAGCVLGDSPGVESGGQWMHGNAVFAAEGVTAWGRTAGSGLRILDSTLHDNGGPAVLLEGAGAHICGNAFAENPVDVAWQACTDTTEVSICAGDAATVNACPEPPYAFVHPSDITFGYDAGDVRPAYR